jgi:glutamate-1-semialdehyde 2,1-aminomutase
MASALRPAHEVHSNRRSASRAAFQRARGLIPGGVNSPARAFGGVGGEPIFFQSARGQHLTDIDGNTYLDYIGSWGPMILGHRHPRVIAAIEQRSRRARATAHPPRPRAVLLN